MGNCYEFFSEWASSSLVFVIFKIKLEFKCFALIFSWKNNLFNSLYSSIDVFCLFIYLFISFISIQTIIDQFMENAKKNFIYSKWHYLILIRLWFKESILICNFLLFRIRQWFHQLKYFNAEHLNRNGKKKSSYQEEILIFKIMPATEWIWICYNNNNRTKKKYLFSLEEKRRKIKWNKMFNRRSIASVFYWSKKLTKKKK